MKVRNPSGKKPASIISSLSNLLEDISELGFNEEHIFSCFILPYVFIEYHPLEFTLEYTDMVRVKTKAIRTRHGAKEPASSSGKNNNHSKRSSSPPKEGEHSTTLVGLPRWRALP